MPSKKSIWLFPRFTLYGAGTLFQILSNSLYLIAMPLLVYDLTQSAGAMSTMAVFETLPQLLLGPFIGTLIDRVNRRRLILGGLLAQAGLLLLIPLLYETNMLPVWGMYGIGMLVSIVQTAVRNAQFTVMPVLFEERRMEANAAISAIWSGTMMFGGPLAGWLIALVGSSLSILFNAGLMLLVFVMTILLRIPDQELGKVSSAQQMLEDTKEGFRYIFAQPTLVALMIVFAISNLADNGLAPVLLFHLKHNLGMSDNNVGLCMGAAGVGLFVGSLVAGRLQARPAGSVIWWFLLVNNIGVAIFLLPGFWAVVVAQFTFHVGGMVSNITKSVIIQTTTPNDLLGRVSSTMRLLEQGTQPLSLMLLGWLSTSYGTQSAFITVVALTMVSTLVMVMSPLRRVDLQGLESSGGTRSA